MKLNKKNTRWNHGRNREDRKATALVRQEMTAKKTPQERLELLDIKLGKDVGAKKEREKLLKLCT